MQKLTPMHLIKLGIGDVTEPLAKACRDAIIEATKEMGDRNLFSNP